MNRMIKTIFYIFIAIACIMAISNPNLKDLKEHIGYNDKTQIVKKTHNYIIYSIYEVYTIKMYSTDRYNDRRKTYNINSLHGYPYIRDTYIGFMKNFWN